MVNHNEVVVPVPPGGQKGIAKLAKSQNYQIFQYCNQPCPPHLVSMQYSEGPAEVIERTSSQIGSCVCKPEVI